jgi:hypothetical protein
MAARRREEEAERQAAEALREFSEYRLETQWVAFLMKVAPAVFEWRVSVLSGAEVFLRLQP